MKSGMQSDAMPLFTFGNRQLLSFMRGVFSKKG
jgi:hypothetical protein